MASIETEGATPSTGSGQTALRDWVRALEAIAPIVANPRRLLPCIIEDVAQSRGEAPALVASGESLTYRGLAARANTFARWALDQGLAKGETVCLMMPNRPEYLAIWLGLTRIGIVVSLINTHLRDAALAHCIEIVAPKHIITAAEFAAEVGTALPGRAVGPKTWLHGGGDEFDRIDRAVERFSGNPLTAAECRDVTIADRALLIYTSGTTGLPKAVNVSHRRILEWSFWFAGLMDCGPDDRMYNCLPMYHSVGGVVATGAVLVRGGSVLIRDKFSAHRFWDDVVDGGCTLVQYIGELARYLVNAPENPRERAHRLRICCGNGLSVDIWEKFQERFAIPRILEFYAATEGSFSLYNVEGKIGAIGRVPAFLTHRFLPALVKCDPATGELARGPTGFCTRCAADEVGEALGLIRGGNFRSGGEFEGYSSAKDSEQKIVRDVFERDDVWYRTGDLMRMDSSGFFYFVDRIGGTFRWKGENVSTTEVATVITAFPGILEASVYGVPVPGTEGAAGMAAITSDSTLNFAEFRKHLVRRLPAYARPLFLRIVDRIEATSTFKHTKSEFKREGYNPAATSDAILFDDAARQAFVRLDRALYERIQAGKVRL